MVCATDVGTNQSAHEFGATRLRIASSRKRFAPGEYLMAMVVLADRCRRGPAKLLAEARSPDELADARLRD